VTENEPLDTWDEDETILTPDGDDEVNMVYAMSLRMFRLIPNFLCSHQDMETEDGELTEGDSLPKASTKKKPPKIEENRSKKEHVNVVFIGHVGESFDWKETPVTSS
jgi:hypothetical protein